MPPSFPHAYLFVAVDPKTIAEKRVRERCISHRCRRRAVKGKYRCATCRSRLYRLRNDAHYAYDNLRSSARKRGIEFSLAFEDFLEFCAVTGYLEMRGKEPHSYSIDRIKTNGAYCLGNIRILTYADNVSHKYEEAAARCRRRRVA